jgi:hypothetical protein
MKRDDFDHITNDGHKSDGLVVVTQFAIVGCMYVCPRLANVEPTFYTFPNNGVMQMRMKSFR